MSDSDRQALRLAQDLREEMLAALPQLPAAPSVSPFVDQSGMPSVLLKMDAETAHALMAVLAERRAAQGGVPGAEPRRADGSHVPPPVAQAVPAAQGPIVAAAGPYGGPAYPGTPYPETSYPEAAYPEAAYPDTAYQDPAYQDTVYQGPGYAEAPFVPQQPGAPVFTGGTGPTPLVPTVYRTH
ncbi:hypothetical protein [Actinomadura bangladeshensis]|uniref:Uncharacterized protein n=1 Tax=Actinomadura bangladeshensis TaxID=453573 RepID=A0A6L9QRH8_9ACTN|nr:hypothetical protein [Actinomadura bangladeshensis]NEA28097.1 hypothetical protein [Actinomadura bangladeshensis]